MEPIDQSDPDLTQGLRLAAGQDPAKRSQILQGAARVIERMGYDAACVADIAREAGVSKGTIYVYFQGKEDLFEAFMEQKRDQLFREVEAQLEQAGTLDERLMGYGILAARRLCSIPVIRAHRVVIGVTERMPEMGTRFYERGSVRGLGLLARMFEREVVAGRLEIPDVPLAAAQFFELCMAGLFRRRLFGHMAEPPTEAEIERTVRGAVDMFLLRYGVEGKD